MSKLILVQFLAWKGRRKNRNPQLGPITSSLLCLFWERLTTDLADLSSRSPGYVSGWCTCICPFVSWLAVASYMSLVSYYLHPHPLPLSGEISPPSSTSWTLHGGHVSAGSTSFVRPFLPCTCFAAHGLITTLFAALCNGVREFGWHSLDWRRFSHFRQPARGHREGMS